MTRHPVNSPVSRVIWWLFISGAVAICLSIVFVLWTISFRPLRQFYPSLPGFGDKLVEWTLTGTLIAGFFFLLAGFPLSMVEGTQQYKRH